MHNTLRDIRANADLTRLATGTAAMLWALALWHVFLARGLFGDGSAELLYMMENGGFALFYDSRLTLMLPTQAPAAVAILLGVTDTHLLAQLLSAGFFFLPTALYTLCLFRARRDPVLLAVTVLAIAIVFVPTSFFIMGEFQTIAAGVLLATLVLANGTRPGSGDGLLLCLVGLLLLRSYETMTLFGPMLALLIGCHLRRNGTATARALHGLAILLFVAGAIFSLRSFLGPHVPGHLRETLSGLFLFTTNLQFMLPLAALAVVALGGLALPRLLEGRALYIVAALGLVLVALCPLLWLGHGDMRPYPKSHYHTRMAAGFLAALLALAAWLYAERPRWLPRAFEVLRVPMNGRRLLAFALAALIAALPADLVLSGFWRQSLAQFRATIAAHGGPLPVEQTAFSREPYRHFVEDWALASESIVLRRSPDEGVVLAPQGFAYWQFYDGKKPLPRGLERFGWKD